MKASVQCINGMPQLIIDGTPEVPLLFFGNTDIGKNVTKQAAMAGNAGIHLHSVIYNLHFASGVPDTCPEMRDAASSDAIADLERCLDAVLNGDPQAKIFLRVKVGAYFKSPPDKWKEELIRYVDGSIYPKGADLCLVSTASDRWADAVDEKLTEIVRYMLSAAAYRDHIACIHLENCEWFEYGFRESGSDVSPVADAKFIAWQKQKYGDAHPCVPVPRDLPNNISDEIYPHTLLLDASEQRFIDYFDFINALVASRIERFAKTVKAASDNRLLVLAFYGYLFELADCQSGHYRMQQLLKSPFIDGFAGPVSYQDRTAAAPHGAVGATSAYMTVMDSVARNGKLWFQESDQRTAINNAPDGGWLPNTVSIEDIMQIHRREIGDICLHSCGIWAMDLCDAGWLMEPKLWQNLAALKHLYAQRMTEDRVSGFDVVFVIDEAAESIVGQPSFSGISGNLLSSFRYAAYRAGISFAFAEITDVAEGRFSDGSLFIFLNPYRISHTQAARLHQALYDKTAVWMYGFGVTAPDDVFLLTGMHITEIGSGSTALLPSVQAAKYGFTAPPSVNTVTHRYAAEDGEILGLYEDGKPAFAHSGPSWFWGGTSLGIENIRAFARAAGVPVYTDGEDIFMTDGVFAIHSAKNTGRKTVYHPNGTTSQWDAVCGETTYLMIKP